MAQFMLILHDAPAQFASQFSPEQLQQIIQEYTDWAEKMAAEGRLKGGHKLKDEGGKILSGHGSKFKVVDGPYVETKEIVGGYFLLEADDYAHAVALAKTCPHLKYGPKIDVREIDAQS